MFHFYKFKVLQIQFIKPLYIVTCILVLTVKRLKYFYVYCFNTGQIQKMTLQYILSFAVVMRVVTLCLLFKCQFTTICIKCRKVSWKEAIMTRHICAEYILIDKNVKRKNDPETVFCDFILLIKPGKTRTASSIFKFSLNCICTKFYIFNTNGHFFG